jgi:ABC-type transport system involved in cytochrome bd biosynthesis fused ATPase/permease subunit
VVLDEPTAHLDRETAGAIAAAIERLVRGRTTLLIAHDSRLVAHADRTAEINDGRAIYPDHQPVADASVAA